MRLKQLIEKSQIIAKRENENASDILSNFLFSESYNVYQFSTEELRAIIQELSACYGCPNKDLISQLEEYHEEIFED